MKWNDKYLPYSGENKIIIYNYLLSVINRLSQKKIIPLSSVYVINFILNDSNWDIEIFGSKEKHDWFINEIKNNPFLLDFINTEVMKIAELPEIYKPVFEKTLTDIENEKSEKFANVVQSFIISSPTVRHYYFNSIDLEESREVSMKYAKNNFKRFGMRRGSLEYKYAQLYKVQQILLTEMGLKTAITETSNLHSEKKNLILVGDDNDFIVNVTNWGNFPIVSKKPQTSELFCLVDNISIYILGFVTPEQIKQYSDESYLFLKEKPESTPYIAGFYGFSDNIFSERGNTP